MEVLMEGKQTKGRRVGMINDLRERNSYETLKRRAQYGAGWRSSTAGTCLTAEQNNILLMIIITYWMYIG